MQHITWRLLNGELPTKHPPKVIVVQLGTNDLAGAILPWLGPGAGPDLAQHLE